MTMTININIYFCHNYEHQEGTQTQRHYVLVAENISFIYHEQGQWKEAED